MVLVLKGKALLAMAGVENSHQLALRSQVSYPTVDKYINRPEEMTWIDVKVLSSILVNGVGLTKEEVLNMKVEDLFEWKD